MPKKRQSLESAQPASEQSPTFHATYYSQPAEEQIGMSKHLLPADHKECLFSVIALTYLVIGVVNFFHPGDTSMMNIIISIGGAYVGVKVVETKVGSMLSHFSKHKSK